ncbi:MAG: hypothetical protein LBO69_06185 [Ignavibacteria bacterium]|jgi:hypothetical protein|nr:hypothetical protein [Ignavibacteria bacterium]
MNKIILLLISLLCCCINATAGYTIGIGKTRNSITSIKLNSVDYVHYNQLLRTLSPTLANGKNSNISIMIHPTNFYVRVNRDTNQYVLQLTVPPIEQNGILYVPVESFIAGICSIANLKYDIVYNASYIDKDSTYEDFFATKKIDVKQSDVKRRETPAKKPIANKHIPTLTPHTIEPTIVNPTPIHPNVTKAPIKQEDDMKIDTIPTIDTISTKKVEKKEMRINVFVKPQISKLSSASDYINIEEKKEVKEKPIEPNVKESDIKINNAKPTKNGVNSITPLTPLLPQINHALPPFRRYSIPDTLLKPSLEEISR